MATEYPNVYSTSPLLNVGSTAHTVFDFGFVASVLRIYNAGTVDLYADFKGNVPSTGTSHIVKSGDTLSLSAGPAVGQLGLTTTSTGATGSRVSVLAMSDL